MIKPWKLVLGAGAACVACCAAPIAGAAATLWLGVPGLLAGAMGMLAAFSGSWLPLAIGALALAIVAGTLAWRRRRQLRAASMCGCQGVTGPSACAWPRIGA